MDCGCKPCVENFDIIDFCPLHKAAPQMLDALKLLIDDVAQYEAWQRPCYALDKAKRAVVSATHKG